ncbi:MAG TPA: response regulator transcription factor [Dermatophilaceae bacterium]|jgi:DNA-binding NarL/FixJ family response regulator
MTMLQKRIRVAVIDDHRVFAEALAGRLSDEPDIEVVGIAPAAAEAFELFLHHEIDVVLLDLDLAGEDGLAVGRQLRDQWPDLGIVVVTASADDSRAVEAVQMGVRGWVGKQNRIESLLTAVRGAARGEIHLPAAILTRVLVSLSERSRSFAPDAEAIAILTARELEVLRGLTEGLSRNQIGTLLDVSPNTVRTHIQSILHKLNVHSALAAAAFARRAGVVGLRDGELSPPVT